MDGPPVDPEAPEQGDGSASPSPFWDVEEPFDYQIPLFPLGTLWKSDSADSCYEDFLSPLSRDATVPYQMYLEKVLMKVTDFTYYQAQDEVKPTDLHHGWRQELKELGPIRIPARAEASVYPDRAKPKTPTYRGQTLRPM